MSDKRISELTEQTTLIDNDEFPFVRFEDDIHETYKIKKSNLIPATSIASKTSFGTVKVGNGITVTEGTISVPTTDIFKYTNRIYVSSQGSDTNDGRSPETALKTIKAAARLATTTTEVESIYVGTGEFIEDNPIYLPPGTAVIGDNLRRTILKPLNEGRDFFWWSSGCYISYLVFQDYYFGGFGRLDTSNQINDREFSESSLTFNLFPGHTLQKLPSIYKNGADLIAFQRNNIIEEAYTYMISQNSVFVLLGEEAIYKQHIGSFVDAIINDLKVGGNVNSIKAGKAYRNSDGNLISTLPKFPQTEQAFIKVKELCKTAIMTVPNGFPIPVNFTNPGATTEVSDTINSLSNLIISLVNGGDTPQYHSGLNYILIDQEWIEILDLQDNTITIEGLGKRGISHPINTQENSVIDKHINGAIVSQAGRAFRYAVAFPDQEGYWGKGRISITETIVTGIGTKFTKETFGSSTLTSLDGWSLKVGNISYLIKTINSDTSITLVSSASSIVDKTYKIIPKKEQIFLSPYVQNCSNISVLGKSYYDSITQTYDVNKTRAGGMLVDNAQLDNKTPIPSNVADAFTQIAFGGIGFHLKNNAYAQLVSVFQVFDSVGVLCESGAYVSVTNSATNFGKEGLVAVGFSNAAIPSFGKDNAAYVASIENITKENFNKTDTLIFSSSFTSDSGGTKTKATIKVDINDIEKFEAGQTITINGHTLNPNNSIPINGTGQIISGVNFSNNTIDVILNTPFPNTPFVGGKTGIIIITAGKLETKITVSGFLENPLANYVVKIATLPSHPSGAEYVVNEIKSGLLNNICIFTLQQVIPEINLSGALNKSIELRAPSTVNSSSHTFEYVGAGINYTALPINGGRADKAKQTIEINSGRCYVSATDQDGNFTVGSYFNVNLRTGQITFNGQLNLGVIEALQLLNSPGTTIYEFVTSIRSQALATNNALPTEKAVRDFITDPTVLGSLVTRQPTASGGNQANAGQLVLLNQDGVIESSMIRIPPASLYTVANQTERLVTFINGIILKPGDFVFQQDDSKRYILNSLPATSNNNWQVFATDTFNASAIVSGTLDRARIATPTPLNPANDTTFPNGAGFWVPAVQQLKSVANSPIIVAAQSGTTPVLNGQAGFLEVGIQQASTTQSGAISIATTNEIIAGVNNSKAVTPSQLPLFISNRLSALVKSIVTVRLSPFANTPDPIISGSSTKLYLHPYGGAEVSCFDNTIQQWVVLPLTNGQVMEFDLSAIGANTADTNYDIYAYNVNEGLNLSPAIGLQAVAWTNDTTPPTRSTKDGAIVKANSNGYRYIGVVRTTSAGTTAIQLGGTKYLSGDMSPAVCYVANAFNQYDITLTYFFGTAWDTPDAYGWVIPPYYETNAQCRFVLASNTQVTAFLDIYSNSPTGWMELPSTFIYVAPGVNSTVSPPNDAFWGESCGTNDTANSNWVRTLSSGYNFIQYLYKQVYANIVNEHPVHGMIVTTKV